MLNKFEARDHILHFKHDEDDMKRTWKNHNVSYSHLLVNISVKCNSFLNCLFQALLKMTKKKSKSHWIINWNVCNRHTKFTVCYSSSRTTHYSTLILFFLSNICILYWIHYYLLVIVYVNIISWIATNWIIIKYFNLLLRVKNMRFFFSLPLNRTIA